MKKIIINKCMTYIKKKNNYSEIELKEIEYGLISIYITITKIIFILALAVLLNIFKEVIIFMIFFCIIRTIAFGLHATKSWICWITSTLAFIGIPYICKFISFNLYFKEFICLICVLLIFKNAPADTKKRPIVSKKRRNFFKYISTFIALIYSFCAIISHNTLISNCMLFSLIFENILISPLTYKLFKLPYNNYVSFLKQHPDFTF